MSHDIENKNGVWSFAFTGNRSAIWHRLGNEVRADDPVEVWIEKSGFNYEAEKVPLFAETSHHGTMPTDFVGICRTDNGRCLGVAKDGYHIVQPRDIFAWFEDYIHVDPRFSLDAAGVLRNGERLWCSAVFQDDFKVAGDAHKARLLMSTSLDQTQSTINQAHMERVVCANTLAAAHSDRRAMIKTTHRSKFDGKKVAAELAQIAQSFDSYKRMGDAMASTAMAERAVLDFFKQVLDIPVAAKKEDVSARKMNQYADVVRAMAQTKQERNSNEDTAWTALQAITRYVDHDRSVRNADTAEIGRFDSGTWGSGNLLKGKAVSLLMPLIKDKVAA